MSKTINKKTLLKTAEVLRKLNKNNKELSSECDKLNKKLAAYEKVSKMLEEGLIDSEDLEEKIAELIERPEIVDSLFSGYISKKRDFGELNEKRASYIEGNIDPLTQFLIEGDI